MKKILSVALVSLCFIFMISCSSDENLDSLKGEISTINVNDDRYSLDIKDEKHINEPDKYTAEIVKVSVGEGVKILDKNGDEINASELKVGQKVEVFYSGSVTSVVPPSAQGVSKIVVIEG